MLLDAVHYSVPNLMLKEFWGLLSTVEQVF